EVDDAVRDDDVDAGVRQGDVFEVALDELDVRHAGFRGVGSGEVEQPVADPRIRFGCVFPNLIPVLSPSDLTYIRVDPIGHDRLKLHVRSFEHPEFVELREFRKLAFERTADQDLAVVLRTQRGLHAQGLPAGVQATDAEVRIGHFEQLWVEAMQRDTAQRVPAMRVLR
ncbi:MAG TPA: RHO alpha subunit C-terminal catalytic domain-containing protein, partial [Kofleriaceae bacterium]